jgi:dTDP-4-amino-4,6-dideoxygalactose transaminase/SAM-dependent methyltransferase
MRLPFFAPDVFDDDRHVLLGVLRGVGTAPAQRFILGEHTARLEQLLRDHLGAADVVACGSGTAALGMVLHAMGVGPGVEVIVPALGCAPLAAAVVNLRGTPVFADVDPDTMVIDPDEVEALVTPRTGVIMPAHLFATMADMPRLVELAARRGVRLVEDSAVAQGAVLHGRPAGLWGEAGVFSFVQVKTFGMPGEGGVVITRNAELGAAVRQLRNHGQDAGIRFVHHRIGYNSRFDEVQAAFQVHRFATLPQRLARRAAIADYYTRRFGGLRERGVCPPPAGTDGDGGGRSGYVYALLVRRRDELRAHLASRGIGSHVYYPRPLPGQPAFARYAPPGRCWPHAERASRQALAVPIYPQLTDAQVECIADAVCEFAEARPAPALALAPAECGRPTARGLSAGTPTCQGVAPAARPVDIAAEWRRRAARRGLSRVMRASQPAELNAAVTDRTLAIVAGHLDTVSATVGRPLDGVLEVGCGIGRITPTIAARAGRVHAVDLTAEMIAAARLRCADLGNVEFSQGRVQELAPARPRYDAAVCVWVLMHVLDPAELAAACAAIAATSRYLVLVEYEWARIPVGPFSRLRPLSRYLELLPGAELLRRHELDYGGDRSFAALIALRAREWLLVPPHQTPLTTRRGAP